MSKVRTTKPNVTEQGDNVNDLIVGGSGNDKLYGYGGDDELSGGAGNDKLYGGSGNDLLIGGSGNDHLYGGEGADKIIAGKGNDAAYFTVGESNGDGDVYDGGIGKDTLVITVDRAFLGDPAILQDLHALATFIANPVPGEVLYLSALNLSVSNWEIVRFVGVDGVAFELPPLPNEDENQAPTDISLSNATVAENAAGAIIGNLSTSDVDTGDSHTYSVNDARFEVVNGQLKLVDGVSLNYEAEPSVTVEVTSTDAGGLSVSESFTIAVSDVNTAPTVSLYNIVATLNENTETSSAIKVADIAISDDGTGTNTLSLSGADAASFEILGNELFLIAGTILDFEMKTHFDVTVSVDDASVGVSPDSSVSLSILVNDLIDVSPLFSENFDVVDFSNLSASDYQAGTQYNALAGDDHVYGASSQANADRAGFDLSQTLNLGEGNDQFYGYGSESAVVNESVDGGTGDDRLYGSYGDDTLLGGEGGDYLAGGEGNDFLDGGANEGEYNFYVNDSVFGEGGDDTAVFTVGEVSAYAHYGYYDQYLGGSSSETTGDKLIVRVSAAQLADDTILADLWALKVWIENPATKDISRNFDALKLVASEWEAIEFRSSEDESVLNLSDFGAPSLFTNGNNVVNLDTLDASVYEAGTQYNALAGDDVVYGASSQINADRAGFDLSQTLNLGDGYDHFYAHYSESAVVNESVDGGAGSDYLAGYYGNDMLLGGEGGDYLYGGEGNDLLDGGSNEGEYNYYVNDSVFGEGGDDTATFTVGEVSAYAHYGYYDQYLGGTSSETTGDKLIVRVSAAQLADDAILADLWALKVWIENPATKDISRNFDALKLNASEWEAIEFRSSEDESVLNLSDFGAPSLFSNGNNVVNFDTLDVSVYEAGTQYNALAGDDYVSGASSQDNADRAGFDLSQTLNLGEGNDQFYGYGNESAVVNESVDGGSGDDRLYGSYGDDTLLGGEGGDYLAGGEGNDFLDGGANGDSYYYAGNNDYVNGEGGDDTAVFTVGEVSAYTHYGYYDQYLGGNSSETTGDKLIVRVSAAQLADDAILADLWALKVWIENPETKDTYRNFDALKLNASEWESIEFRSTEDESVLNLSDFGIPSLFTNGNNVVNLDTLDASVYEAGTQYNALAGDDVVYGASSQINADRAGFDLSQTLNLGDGFDQFYAYYSESAALDEKVDGGAGSDYLAGYYGNDTLMGGDGGDYLFGGEGNDLLDGGSNEGEYNYYVNDYVNGQGGDDTATFTVGEVYSYGYYDQYLGGTTSETVGDKLIVRVSAAQLADGDILRDLWALKAWIENPATKDTYRNFDALKLNVSEWEAIEFRSSEDESVLSLSDIGAPSLFTNDNNVVHFDMLDASVYEAGTQYNALAGDDVVYGTSSQANADRAGFDLNQTLNLGEGDDQFYGYGSESAVVNESVDGGAGNDSLYGSYGNDRLLGGDGIDSILGGEGNDFLDGGANGDSYYYAGYNDYVNGEGGDDTAVFTVGEVSAYAHYGYYDQYLGGTSSETTGDKLIVRVSAAQLADGDILRDLWALKAWIENPETKDISHNFDALKLAASEWEAIEFRSSEDESVLSLSDIGAPSLFTNGNNVVNFDTLDVSVYEAGTQYNALAGDDVVYGASSQANADRAGFDLSQTLSLGEGNDQFTAHYNESAVVNEIVDGGAGRDVLYGYYGDDTLLGGEGGDHLAGGEGNDFLDGGANGEEDYYYYYSSDNVNGEGGDDTAVFTVGEVSAYAHYGYYDQYQGGSSSETTGDKLIVRVSAAQLADDAILADLWALKAWIENSETKDISRNFDALKLNAFEWEAIEFRSTEDESVLNLSDFGVPSLFTNGNNVVNFDTLDVSVYEAGTQYNALAGDDVVYGASSQVNADRAGFDLSQTLNLGDGNDQFTAHYSESAALNENVDGGAGDDMLSGYYGDDTLLGGDGGDYLAGGDGNDFLDGGTNGDASYYRYNDNVNGEGGDDTAVFTVGEVSAYAHYGYYDQYLGGSSSETTGDKLIVRVSAAQLADDAILADLWALKVWIEQSATKDTYRNFDALKLNASEWEAIEFRSTEDESVLNLSDFGIPSLFTNGNNVVNFDTLDASLYEAGTQYNALAGDDVVYAASSQANAERAGFDLSQTLNLGDGYDQFYAYYSESAALNERVDGGAGDDVLHGYFGDDTLLGGDGSDSILGGEGNDFLDGGANVDAPNVYGAEYVNGEGGDDTAVFTVGEVSVYGYYDDYVGGSTNEINGDTLIIRVTEDDLAQAEILADLNLLEDHFAGPNPSQLIVLNELQLQAQDFENLQIVDYTGSAINLDDF